jgi:hypothetical protein
VIREFQQGFTTDPAAAEMLGQNLNPASIKFTSNSNNIIRLTVKGVRHLDVWLSPMLVDFKRKIDIKINGGGSRRVDPKLDFEPMLEDLRVRGDRQQIYWYRYTTG